MDLIHHICDILSESNIPLDVNQIASLLNKGNQNIEKTEIIEILSSNNRFKKVSSEKWTLAVDTDIVEEQTRILKSHKNNISSYLNKYVTTEELATFQELAKEKYARDKCRIDQTDEDIIAYFNCFSIKVNLCDNDLFLKLFEKFEVTLHAKAYLPRMLVKLNIILASTYILSQENRLILATHRKNRFKTALAYFIEQEDLIPDTMSGGYLDDLLVFIYAYKGLHSTTFHELTTLLRQVHAHGFNP